MIFKPNGQLVPDGGGDNIPLLREKLTLGRRESCDICLRFPNVSGLHCELSFDDGFWWIKDLSSTNGVKVQGIRVQEKLLHPRDEITIGKRKYTIEYELPADRRPGCRLSAAGFTGARRVLARSLPRGAVDRDCGRRQSARLLRARIRACRD